MMDLYQKKEHLESYLEELGSVVVAFSAGVDSTFLLKTAHDVLGDNVIAATARSHTFPQRELEAATEFCVKEGIEQVIFDSEELNLENFRHNPKNRCYLCKKELFSKIQRIAKERDIPWVVEGSNINDNGDYRPGHIAIRELDIKSPLREAEMTKDDIRQLSKELGLATWNKQSFACLASRFVYGELITEEKLSMVDQAEQFLLDCGFRQVRIRIHDNLARIEIAPQEFSHLFQNGLAEEINQYCRKIGFTYVTLDLGGYQMGSMNRQL